MLLKVELELPCNCVGYVNMFTPAHFTEDDVYILLYLQLDEREVPMTHATAPATAGVAMEVPDILWFVGRVLCIVACNQHRMWLSHAYA